MAPKQGCVFDLSGCNEEAAVEVGEHPLGPGLGTIDADDAEVLRSDGLDPGSDHPARLVDGLGRGREASFRGLESTSHGKDLLVRVGEETNSPQEVCMALRVRVNISDLPHTRGFAS